MIILNGHTWKTLDDDMYVNVNNLPRKIVAVYEGEKKVYPSSHGFYARPDSIVINSGTIIYENNGRRSPTVKLNNGKAAYMLAYNGSGSAYGGNWTLLFGISDSLSNVQFSIPAEQAAIHTKSYIYEGNTYWLSGFGTNEYWGGRTIDYNVLNLPYTNDILLSNVNAFPTQEQFEIIARFLDIKML